MLRMATLLVLVAPAIVFADQPEDAKPLVHPLFSDSMVLQRDKVIPVWGWTKPGAAIAVSFADQMVTTEAGPDGKWMLQVGPLEASSEGRALTVRGPQSITFEDVVVGDVWICSGQSNMEWPVQLANSAEEEIAAANHPNIRLFTVPKRISLTPRDSLEGHWSICSKDTISRFSAVGYFFGREIHKSVGVPVGLIHTSWGGTVAEAWTSGEALKKSMPDFQDSVVALERTAADLSSGKFDLQARVAEWWKSSESATRIEQWKSADFDHTAWKTMELPNNWENANVGLDQYDGIVWFRKTFELPADWQGKDAVLDLGAIDDADVTWVNGHQVGADVIWTKRRSYPVPANILRPGRNVIAVRVFDNSGGGGIFDKRKPLALARADDETKRIALQGSWHFHASTPRKELASFPQAPNQSPNTVTVLYNGMLAPLKPFGIKGAIWYQGESNALPLARALQYRRLLPTMISDWRNQFGQGDFPFLIVQLANFMPRQDQPVQSGWAELREAQQLTARDVPNVGLAVTTDIGEAADIHPRNKQDVGKRLALQALHLAYQRNVVHAGPTYKDRGLVGDTLRVEFDNVGGGLMVQGNELRGFAIAELGGEFAWAKAVVEGNTVIVSHEDLAEPIHVRYNWANNPVGNLFNKEGLPAAPFRTDVSRAPAPPSKPAQKISVVDPALVGMSRETLAKVKPTLQEFVDKGRVAGAVAIAAKEGKTVLFEAVGHGDLETKQPMAKDSIVRIFSMTKPVTSTAIMILVEQGKLGLDDPAEQHLPELKGLRVVASPDTPETLVDQTRRMTIRDLLRHTSGLTYGLFGNSALDARYRQSGLLAPSTDANQMLEKLSGLPLMHQPGTRFEYSVSTDVLGHIVERVAGVDLDQFFRTHIFEPLAMRDTGFHVPREKAHRFIHCYSPSDSGLIVSDAASKSAFLSPPRRYSGGGGLVSTAEDYLRFAQMIVNRGELDGIRILEPSSVNQMITNQLSKAAYPIQLGGSRNGVGFGLGFSVVVERTDYTSESRLGEFGWGGIASTHFWGSPEDQLVVVVLSQLTPFSSQLRDAVRPLIYDSIE